MSAQALLAELAKRDITLKAEGDRLKFTPVESVTPDLLARLKAHKPELLARLKREALPVEPIPAKAIPQSAPTETAKPSFCDTAIEVRLSDGGWALVKPSLAGDKKYLAWVAGLFPEAPNQAVANQAKIARKIP